MKLNEKILYCRKKAGLSQEGLAEELGVSRQAVSKWETGDAVPEIGKLVALAKTFSVTTDWLLSEEDPEEKRPEERYARETEAGAKYNGYYQEAATWGESSAQSSSAENYQASSGERFEKTMDDWMDRVPGVLGKMVRRFGWIAGAYIAAGGAGLTAIGFLAKMMVNSMASGFKNATDSMFSGFGGGLFGGSTVTFYDESGNQLSAVESAELAEIFSSSGNSGFYSSGGMDGMVSSGLDAMHGMVLNNPVSIFANIMIGLGLIMLIGGTVFAVVWYKKSKEQ